MMKKTDKMDINLIRLNKFIADSGYTSRRKADELILSGVVKVNNKTVNQPGTKVSSTDTVKINGNAIRTTRKLTYILLNKPKDYITTTSDEKGRKTVMDIVKKKERLYPVGRLDRNTTGALLITNDGEMANRLMHPKYQIERVYNVVLAQKLKNDDMIKISKGVPLDDGISAKSSIIINPTNTKQVTLGITEGKNREVRRIFESLGYEVKKLDRKFYAHLSTQGLGRGEYRHLTKREITTLKKMCGLV